MFAGNGMATALPDVESDELQMRTTPLRVLLADDHPIYRDAVRVLIGRAFAGAEIVTAGSAEELLAHAADAPFALVLIDWHMPGMAGLASICAALEAFAGSPVAIMSGMAPDDEVRGALRAGARAFLPKLMSAEMFAAALQIVLAGGTYVPADTALSAAETPATAASPLLDALTRREREVLEQLADGATNKHIARALELAEITVKLHVRQILRKLGASNRAEAVAIYTRQSR